MLHFHFVLCERAFKALFEEFLHCFPSLRESLINAYVDIHEEQHHEFVFFVEIHFFHIHKEETNGTLSLEE